MKKDFLVNLGVSEEQIEKILQENKKELDTKSEELKTLTGNLQKANEQIKAFEDMDVEKIKQEVKTWQDKASDMEKALANQKQSYLLDKKLSGVNAHDSDVIKSLLKSDTLKFTDDDVLGFDEQINSLKQSKPFLFISEQKPNSTGTTYSFARANTDTNNENYGKKLAESFGNAPENNPYF